jgi:pyruvate,water dikinase
VHADSWETRPQLALAALDRVRHQRDDESPMIRHRAAAAQREVTTAEVRARVADDPELSAMVDAALGSTNMMAFRERTKTTIVKAIHEARMIFRELGRRHAAAGDLHDADHIFMLLESELDSFVSDPASFTETLARRAEDYAHLWELEPPFFVTEAGLPPLDTWARRAEAGPAVGAEVGSELRGVSGSPGVVQGIARVVTDPGDPSALQPGDILVAPFTDPSWTPLFMTAGAVVVEVGGQISHAVIVSRELGLPCVVSLEGATRSIPDGARISVDGGQGTVTVLEAP